MKDFIKGMDLSTLLELEQCHAEYYDGEEKRDVLEILKKLDLINRRKYEDRWVNKETEVLFEEENTGYTREYVRVKDTGEEIKPGTILKGRISSRISGEIMEFIRN